MHVTMQLKTGSEAGRKVHLVSHQLVCVGSSSWADFVLSSETELAEQHFVLETDAQACRVRDVSKGRGVLLNGEPVLSAVVHHGDCLRVGKTEFVLLIEGEMPSTAAEPVVARPPSAPPPVPKAESPPIYHSEQFETGVIRYEGKSVELEPAMVVRRLATIDPAYAIADLRNLAAEARPSPADGSYLFEWLGAAAAGNSPVLLQQDETDIPQLIGQAWQRNAVVCLFSHAKKEELLVHLRERAKLNQGQILGICWPQTLGPLLERYHKEFAETFLKPLRAVFVEGAASPDSWYLYCWEPLDETLVRLGLEPEETTK
jgi:pSer/pThr/pTyr-binding forkhead associated (FHA) protein